MKKENIALNFFLDMAKTQAIMERRFDSRLGGINFSWFIILNHLSASGDGKMRRIDLAEKVGLTASGVTRILLPMEKIGLVKRELSDLDGRVSYVALAAGGKKKLNEALERAEIMLEEIIPEGKIKKLEEMIKLLGEIIRS
jgi:DNA-binding MarR family transcriptional regulator